MRFRFLPRLVNSFAPASSAGLALGIWLTLGIAPAQAQDLTKRARPQEEPLVLIHGRVHPVSGPVIPDGFVLFENGKITRVGPMPEAPNGNTGITGIGPAVADLPAKTKTLDVKGKHVYPGFFGAKTQMGLDEIASVRAMRDFNEAGELTPEVVASVAVNPDSTLMPVARTNGILLTGTFPSGGLLPGRASVIQLEGWTSDDLTIRSDASLVIQWPNMRTVRAPWMDKSDEEQQREIRTSLERLREVFRSATAYANAKRLASEGKGEKPGTDLRYEAMARYLAPFGDQRATAQGRVLIEAADTDQILAAVAFAKEFGLRIAIVGGRDAAGLAKILKERQIPVIVAAPFGFPKRDDSAYNEAYTLPLKLHEAGVTFAIASGEETPHERNLPYAAAMAVAHGLPWEAALRAITLSPAEILDVADRVGSLEPGKDATLIVTDGIAMEVTTTVTLAFVQGRQIDLRNKQSELADKYRERYAPTGPAPAPQKPR